MVLNILSFEPQRRGWAGKRSRKAVIQDGSDHDLTVCFNMLYPLRR